MGGWDKRLDLWEQCWALSSPIFPSYSSLFAILNSVRPPPATTSNLSAESSSIWESFKADAGKSASTSQPSTSTAFSQDIPTNGQANGNSQNGTEPKDQEQAYVKVIQTYRFAGDDVTWVSLWSLATRVLRANFRFGSSTRFVSFQTLQL